jgi:lipopolysaccharide transport system ATP-binding protein
VVSPTLFNVATHSDSDIAIKVRSLGKSYRIQHKINSGVANQQSSRLHFPWPWSANQGRSERITEEVFWALRDVSFDVSKGKVFGIIGQNGAGKSTMLKLLSRITDPTEGYAEIRGRVGSLLEVGTGFHPELSGRENIYLNGTLLGMRRREINSVLDDIIDFAEVSRFIDTPVKRYSSGMYVRLAFAVAAHLEPEILIIDEVLAVGDLRFQQKCLGKMKDVTGHGRTVLFVSHSLNTVNTLCDECLLLENGQVKQIGPTSEVTAAYFNSNQDGSGPSLDLSASPHGDEVARLLGARLIDEGGRAMSHARLEVPFGIEMSYELFQFDQPVIPNLHFYSSGSCAFVTSPTSMPSLQPGIHRAVVWLPQGLLNAGSYTVNIAASSTRPVRIHFHLMDRFSFSVIEDLDDDSRQGYVHSVPGVVRPRLHWDILPGSS